MAENEGVLLEMERNYHQYKDEEDLEVKRANWIKVTQENSDLVKMRQKPS